MFSVFRYYLIGTPFRDHILYSFLEATLLVKLLSDSTSFRTVNISAEFNSNFSTYKPKERLQKCLQKLDENRLLLLPVVSIYHSFFEENKWLDCVPGFSILFDRNSFLKSFFIIIFRRNPISKVVIRFKNFSNSQTFSRI